MPFRAKAPVNIDGVQVGIAYGIYSVFPEKPDAEEEAKRRAALWEGAASLLEALETVLPHVGVGYSGKQRRDILAKARAALNAAKGEGL